MIARIRSQVMLTATPLRDFVLKALATDPLIESPARALAELALRLSENTCGVFVGHINSAPKALLIADANTSEFSRAVVVVHIYNRGGIPMLQDLFSAMHDFKCEHGLSRVHGIDINERPEAYVRLFKFREWRPKPVGTFYQFTEH